jgi:MFS family permease
MLSKIKGPRTIRRMMLILYIISVFEVISRNLFGPLYAVYVSTLGGDLIASGAAVAINTAIVGVFIIISGRIASKYHTEKHQLVLGYGLSTLVYLGYIFIDTPMQLFALEAISGIATAIEVPAFSGLFSALQKRGKHSRGWGDFLGSMNLISAGALLASGAIAQTYGFNALFLTMFGFQSVCMIAAIFLFRYKVSQHR